LVFFFIKKKTFSDNIPLFFCLLFFPYFGKSFEKKFAKQTQKFKVKIAKIKSKKMAKTLHASEKAKTV
jgi:hypothetical protein